MAVLVAAILTSCSNSDDENKEEIVDTTPVNITVGKTWNINGAKNLVTSNDFIVTANGGSITSILSTYLLMTILILKTR